ncbi:bifunctional 2-C-methyl-D-erythritol 4-phosphate cytidylyltransferase/2-C-methyl-D-erythritol 2,4-cyclodiphosphate synthase [Consotaella salsifontis]|uniref:bifunctional 2-C-methyl-D-erythritol 4-phosphate cytidylyltransferase/2-C-methyl-D-erythritol 2,4-cyclodiphosphate synthase n=1 Tax=Consotaella salsifontis TaxID=1365950 RepID=UPI00099AE8F7|nr:bifunctional 2-C-methyl-D-erythritol 4-phosphate cytidylyltransferase/2-C-methyl-D-erythritol 2,4-cyclodiphosphate synthase [Consotaella salsifontis]
MKAAAVIVAAGKGERARQTGGLAKQYQRIGDHAVIWYALAAFVGHQDIDTVSVVINDAGEEDFTRAAEAFADRVRIVRGGASRQASVRAGLSSLRDAAPDFVLIHDGARPFVDEALIARVLGTLATHPGAGALPALPVSDTIKRERDGLVGETLDRAGLFAAQTPQGFPYRMIADAHDAAAGFDHFTDDAAIAEWAEIPVVLVEGSAANVKLTTAQDIAIADQKLKKADVMIDVRTGNGYDVHALVPGDHVTLCGVVIPHTQALSGHSDADVGLHALTDSLLATCGAGDIGDHFPPSDPKWKGAASHIFVEHAVRIVREKGGRIGNADITLICEAPKIATHREAMRSAIAAMTGLDLERVSVKATTNEKIGFIGRREGIAAIATASVVYGEGR